MVDSVCTGLKSVYVASGPRKNGEGVEDHNQGIISTVFVNER